MFRTLTPWAEKLPQPLGRIEEEFGEMMDRFFRPEINWWKGANGFVPQANIAETENALEVTLELPGMKPEEVKVEVKGEELWITGEKKEEKEEKGKTFHRVERKHGQFRRVFGLPGTVNPENVVAKFEGGVLKVHVPKTEAAKPKQIEVTAT